MNNTAKDKPEIDYPCTWSYRTIGLDIAEMTNSVKELMGDKAYTYKEKNRKGKYFSMELSLIVNSEKEREDVFNSLKKASVFKMIL